MQSESIDENVTTSGKSSRNPAIICSYFYFFSDVKSMEIKKRMKSIDIIEPKFIEAKENAFLQQEIELLKQKLESKEKEYQHTLGCYELRQCLQN